MCFDTDGVFVIEKGFGAELLVEDNCGNCKGAGAL